MAGPFSPIGHLPTLGQTGMQLGFPSDTGNTSYVYQYGLRLDVRPAAVGNTVPEPDALALAALALAAAGISTTRRRRGAGLLAAARRRRRAA